MSARRQTELVRLPLPSTGVLQLYLSYADLKADWTVVYVHGFGSTRTGLKTEAFEQACAKRGWTFVAFDFRGHGASTGTLLELTGTGLLEDLEAVRNYLAGRGIPRCCLVGSSMGGWAAAWFTLRHPNSVPGCVLLAPAFDFLHRRVASLSPQELAHWQETGRLRVRNEWVDVEVGYGLAEELDQFPPERLATELARPVLIFHGVQDATVPYTVSTNFLERA